ncbi:MAG: ATP-binding protein [Anaerolineae bacterium]
MREIALHLLDIAENSVAAGASRIEMLVEEDLVADQLTLVVQDNGKGMDEQLLRRVTDPFVTSRTTRKVGLGLPLLKAAAEACRGRFQLSSTPGQGTRLEVEFQRSHIDRMPLGDLAGTWLTLVVGFPQIHWLFHYRARVQAGQADEDFTFDNEPIKQELGEIPLTEPSILAFIRELLQEGVGRVQQAITQSEAQARLNRSI